MKVKAIIKGSVRLINVLRAPNVTQELQPVRQDMNAFKKHVNHTLGINSQLVSSDSSWPSAAFVTSPGTNWAVLNSPAKNPSHASAKGDTEMSSDPRLCSPVVPLCLVPELGLVPLLSWHPEVSVPPGCPARVTW